MTAGAVAFTAAGDLTEVERFLAAGPRRDRTSDTAVVVGGQQRPQPGVDNLEPRRRVRGAVVVAPCRAPRRGVGPVVEPASLSSSTVSALTRRSSQLRTATSGAVLARPAAAER